MDSEMDEVGGIIAAFEAQVGERHQPLALIGRFRVRAGAGPRIEKEFGRHRRRPRVRSACSRTNCTEIRTILTPSCLRTPAQS